MGGSAHYPKNARLSPSHVRSIPSPVQNVDFVLKGHTFDGLALGFTDVEYRSKKRDQDLGSLSRKVSKVSVVQVLRRNLKYKYPMNSLTRGSCSMLESNSDVDSSVGQTSDSLDNLSGIMGVKAELAQ